ncbi:type II toxin-antitoxin system RelE/ParE family toxin [Lacticaseibacillus hulanensis]|uniref:type II toxin-antitoxin system RelE/ParE family toxin n=1 Tax=Lacticaseibacillus hulanensis TaxID=2493111 RepID=UPI000FD7CDA7|nr:type II toxin-antitoxin system RelE/ParE family toxin [Lacticaseibacillus hulanensis]
MTFAIKYMDDARADLHIIHDYIESEFDPHAANKALTAIMHSVDSLAEFSNRGPRLSSRSPFKDTFAVFPDKYRFVFTDMNVIFYSVDARANEIRILRVFDKRESITARVLAYFNDDNRE